MQRSFCYAPLHLFSSAFISNMARDPSPLKPEHQCHKFDVTPPFHVPALSRPLPPLPPLCCWGNNAQTSVHSKSITMKAIYVHSVLLFLSTLILSVFATTRKYDLKIEQKDVSPDGQEYFYKPKPTL